MHPAVVSAWCNDVAASAEACSDTLSTSNRSSSPVKRVAALRYVGSGISFKELNDLGAELGTEGKKLLSLLRDSSDGVGALPSALEPELLAENVRIRPFELDIADLRDREELLAELRTAREITKASVQCTAESESEPEWNNAVHGRLLRLGLKNSDRVGFRYITAAKIRPQYLPTQSGFTAASKMVDYAIYLEPGRPSTSKSSASRSLPERISAVVNDISQSINHTSYVPLSHRPIAISIKTTSRTEEEAKVQLAIWVAAQLERIRNLIEDTASLVTEPALTKVSCGRKAKAPLKVPDRNAVLGEMVFPLLYIHADRWEVYFARPSPQPLTDKNITIYVGPTLGRSSTLRGTYRILRALRALEQWVHTTYRKWWQQLLHAT